MNCHDVNILIEALEELAGWFPLHGEDAADMRDHARNALDSYYKSCLYPSNMMMPNLKVGGDN